MNLSGYKLRTENICYLQYEEIMAFKDWLQKIIGREPSPQELADAEKEIAPPAPAPVNPPVPAPINPPVTQNMDAVIQRMEQYEKTQSALLQKLDAEAKAREDRDKLTLEQAKADLQKNIALTIEEATKKGILPAENKETIAHWTTLLNTNYEASKAVLMAGSPINAGSPPPSGDKSTPPVSGTNPQQNQYQSTRQAAAETLKASMQIN